MYKGGLTILPRVNYLAASITHTNASSIKVRKVPFLGLNVENKKTSFTDLPLEIKQKRESETAITLSS